MRRRTILFAALASAAVGIPLQADAQTQPFPSRPVHIIVPYSVGGPADGLARMLGQKLSQRWGQPVIVDNKPGANTTIGMEIVAKAKPDGYTLILGTTAMAINDAIVDHLPYNTSRDFTPIVNLVASSSLLAVHPSVPAHNLRELIAVIKASPGRYTYGSGGVGSPTHAAGALFESMAGLQLMHVPYQGIAPAIRDLLAGTIDLVFGDPAVMLPYVRAGKLRAIGVTSRTRYPAAPDVPTLDEAGLPGYESSLWYGILGPARLPTNVTETLNKAFVEVLKDGEIRRRLGSYGMTVIGDSPAHFAALIETEIAKWKRSAGSLKASGTTH